MGISLLPYLGHCSGPYWGILYFFCLYSALIPRANNRNWKQLKNGKQYLWFKKLWNLMLVSMEASVEDKWIVKVTNRNCHYIVERPKRAAQAVNLSGEFQRNRMLRQEEGHLSWVLKWSTGWGRWQLIKVVVCTYERYRKGCSECTASY